MCNGMLAGLVAITAPCAFVTSASAMFIGAAAGILVIYSVTFIERTLKIDDPAGAISVHGTCGRLGNLTSGCSPMDATATDGTAWPARARIVLWRSPQLAASVIGIVVCFAWVGAVTFIAYRVIDKLIGHRTRRRTSSADWTCLSLVARVRINKSGAHDAAEAPGPPIAAKLQEPFANLNAPRFENEPPRRESGWLSPRRKTESQPSITRHTLTMPDAMIERPSPSRARSPRLRSRRGATIGRYVVVGTSDTAPWATFTVPSTRT